MTIASWVDDTLAQLPRTTEEQRRRAARRVVTAAVNATDAAELLDALGLTVADGLRPARGKPAPDLRATA